MNPAVSTGVLIQGNAVGLSGCYAAILCLHALEGAPQYSAPSQDLCFTKIAYDACGSCTTVLQAFASSYLV